MKFANTKRDLTIVCSENGAPGVLVPGTGMAKDGEFRTGSVEIPDAELALYKDDLSKLIHAGRLKVSDEDREFLEATSVLQPKQV